MVYPIGLSPNIEREDVLTALAVLFAPRTWFQENGIKEVSSWFHKTFSTPHICFFTTGRSALTMLLQSMDIGSGDEVIVQAFTCMVVPNAIRFAGATPVFVDVDNSANCDPHDIERKITPHTKAIIVQHTFGTPADMDRIVHIAKKHAIMVIEDCAHALGATYKGSPVGSLGDAAFFSFGRDKSISSVFGGAVIVKQEELARRLRTLEWSTVNPSKCWIIQQLLHPIVTWIVLPMYASLVGKGMLVMFQTLHLLSFPVNSSEKRGEKPKQYVMRYPNALALLLITQIKKLDRYIKNRRETASLYTKAFKNTAAIRILDTREGSSRLRFGIQVKNQSDVLQYAKDNGVVLGNWYHAVIDPAGSDWTIAGYKKGSCKNAERIAREIINLPTRISNTDAREIISLIKTAA